MWQHHPAADGLLWMSVRDNRHQVVMLFGDRFGRKKIKLAFTRPIARYESDVLALLDELGCGLALG